MNISTGGKGPKTNCPSAERKTHREGFEEIPEDQIKNAENPPVPPQHDPPEHHGMLQYGVGGIDAHSRALLSLSQATPSPLEVSTGTGSGSIDDLPGGKKTKSPATPEASQDHEDPKALTAVKDKHIADHLDPFGMAHASQQGSVGSSSPPMPSQTCQPPVRNGA